MYLDGHQAGAAAVVEFVQVGLVLEEVGIHALLVDLYVGLHVVGEDADGEVDALFFQGRFMCSNFRMGDRGGGYGDFFSLVKVAAVRAVRATRVFFRFIRCFSLLYGFGMGVGRYGVGPEHARKYVPVGLESRHPWRSTVLKPLPRTGPISILCRTLENNRLRPLFNTVTATAEIQNQSVSQHL